MLIFGGGRVSDSSPWSKLCSIILTPWLLEHEDLWRSLFAKLHNVLVSGTCIGFMTGFATVFKSFCNDSCAFKLTLAVGCWVDTA